MTATARLGDHVRTRACGRDRDDRIAGLHVADALAHRTHDATALAAGARALGRGGDLAQRR